MALRCEREHEKSDLPLYLCIKLNPSVFRRFSVNQKMKKKKLVLYCVLQVQMRFRHIAKINKKGPRLRKTMRLSAKSRCAKMEKQA